MNQKASVFDFLPKLDLDFPDFRYSQISGGEIKCTPSQLPKCTFSLSHFLSPSSLLANSIVLTAPPSLQ